MKDQAGWALHPKICNCDIEFINWLSLNEVHDKFIFHMGPGLHHQVGIWASYLRNNVVSLTISAEEDAVYDKMIEKRWKDRVSVPYLCQYGDIQDFRPGNFRSFDLVTLFHLGEMGDDHPLPVISRFTDQLTPGGSIVFYTGSAAWDKIEGRINLPNLHMQERFKSLEFWKKTL